MKEVVFYLSLTILAGIAIEDYKFRAVSWVLFPLLFVSFTVLNLQNFQFGIILENVAFNFLFLFVILLSTTIYFSLKEKKLVNISNGFLGLGDILFLVSLCVLFSPFNYIIFFLSSLSVIILFYLIFAVSGKLSKAKIPLAGLQAILLIGLMLYNNFFPFIHFYSDEWMLKVYSNG